MTDKPTWTREAPTEPGWYWWRDEDRTPFATEVISDWQDGEIKVEISNNRWDYISALDHGEWWPVPIQPPEES